MMCRKGLHCEIVYIFHDFPVVCGRSEEGYRETLAGVFLGSFTVVGSQIRKGKWKVCCCNPLVDVECGYSFLGIHDRYPGLYQEV